MLSYRHPLLHRNAYFFLPLIFLSSFSSGQSIFENTQVRFFTDAGFKAARDSTDEFMPEFQSGGIEILITAQITDKISLLAEPVLKLNGTVSLERAMIKYSFNHYLNISAGRLYTPIGLWNTTYFRFAKALTPTIDAPQIIANNEEGGIAINKDNGIMVSGDDISNLRFGYRAMVGNGYNKPNSRDKQYIGNVFMEPIDDLRFAVSVSTTKTTGIFTPTESTLRGIALACMYMGGKDLEFAYEYYLGRIFNDVYNSIGHVHYGYAGYKIQKFTPYVQYYNGVAAEDGIFKNRTKATLGLRYHFTALSVLKAEAEFLEADNFAKVNQFKFQWAIGF